jgi:hypothetical protein
MGKINLLIMAYLINKKDFKHHVSEEKNSKTVKRKHKRENFENCCLDSSPIPFLFYNENTWSFFSFLKNN